METHRHFTKKLEGWKASKVQRFHTVPSLMQSNAEHSFGVAYLASTIYPDPTLNLLRACLYHDLAEDIVGDVPYQVKRDSPELKAIHVQMEDAVLRERGLFIELSPEEAFRLKFCDMLDLVLHCAEHYKMGNTHALVPLKRGAKVLTQFGGMSHTGRIHDYCLGAALEGTGIKVTDVRDPERKELMNG